MQAATSDQAAAGAALFAGLGIAVILFLLAVGVVLFLVFAYFFQAHLPELRP